jgi:hypothetical protein
LWAGAGANRAPTIWSRIIIMELDPSRRQHPRVGGTGERRGQQQQQRR